jgi:hypothetical protein
MAALVTLATAKTHLRITDSDHDVDVQMKADQATDAIVDYLGPKADPAWDETTVPGRVQAAILLLTAQLYEHRGEDLAPDAVDEAVWDAIRRLLMRIRDPVIA